MKKNLHFITLIMLIVLLIQSPVYATDKQISYQGQLSDSNGNPVADGLYSLDFVLYNDSVGGSIVWGENAEIQTSNGLFSYQIGSSNTLSSSIFQQYPELYLELRILGEAILPRTKLGTSAYAFSAQDINGYDSSGVQSLQTDSEKRSFIIFDTLGEDYITLQQKEGDSSVMLPESSIHSDEILNEPGIAVSLDISLKTLTNSEMMDLTKITVEIPEEGYIVLYGKCYLLLSGTTGANQAIIQIDQNEGGNTQFPYFSIAGLSGYQNSGTNYFPVMVTRVYYKSKGTHTFRLEGKANNPLPAVAQSWDHILNAVYYPTSYYGVEAIVANPLQFDNPLPLSSKDLRDARQFFKVDLRELEVQDKK